MRKPSRLATILVIAACVLILQGCEEEELVRPDRNRAPETILSVGPDHGDRVFHKYRVRWTGLDRDGVVVAYMVASVPEDELFNGRTSYEDIVEYLLDLPWGVTDQTESLFVFRADRPNSRNHSIYVMAIDNEGKSDPSPAMANFLAIDYGLPQISVCMESNVSRYSSVLDAVVPPDSCAPTAVTGDTLPYYNLEDPGSPIVVTLRWDGEDPDGHIVEWRYRIDSKSEQTVPADVKSISLNYDPQDPVMSDIWTGFHEFRVVAVDDANARSEEKEARFVLNYDPNTIIDSVWTFRKKVDNKPYEPNSLPDKLIYARAWRDSAEVYAGVDRVGYHFGQLKLKFHATDKDGPPGEPPPDLFKWNIAGTLLKSDWISNPCGQSDTVDFYCAVTDSFPYLDSDRPFRLYVSSRDRVEKSDGSPDTIMFEVNVTPELQGISYEVLDAGSGTVKFTWQAFDPDEGYGWGVATGEKEQALMKYRYRIDEGQWRTDGISFDRSTNRYRKDVTVESIEAGSHTFDLVAYNGDYIQTRADTLRLEFGL